MGKTANSIASLKDIVMNETVKSPACTTGFGHSQAGFSVSFYNGSEIQSLNGSPDNNRSKRATLVFFDESGFMNENTILVTEAFASQDSNFKTSIDEDFNYKTLRKRCPTQLIYASSASDIDTTFYKYYKDFAKNMMLGNREFFCCDISCEIPLNPTMDGEKYPALLTQAKVDKAMRTNREKGSREYYNKFTTDGGEDQAIKRSNIVRNETFLLPEMGYANGGQYSLNFDPARTNDQSIVLVMKMIKDERIGYYGEIVNCTNLIDIASKKGYKMKSPDQIKALKQMILDYNGNAPDYKNIESISIDAGAGGGGISAYSDNLLDDWKDNKGISHKGFLDQDYDLYEGDIKNYPNASNKLSLISPAKYRLQMCEEFVELMDLDLIKFPKEYDGKGYVNIEQIDSKGESKLSHRHLSMEEEVSLINIDVLKTEITSMHKYKNSDGVVVRYALPKDKERKMHDDRFYCILLASHRLYQLRRNDLLKQEAPEQDFSQFMIIPKGSWT